METWLDKNQNGIFQEWTAVRRTPSLIADLDTLGVEPVYGDPFDWANDIASIVGVTYVAEGSRLGGAVLAKRVAPNLPRAYLGSQRVMPLWKNFLGTLETLLTTPDDRNRAILAAVATFERFGAAGSRAMQT